MNLPDEVVKDLVDYIEKTGAALTEVDLQKKAAAEEAPKTVEILIKKGFLQPEMRESAIAAASDPVKVQASLRKIAEAAFTPPTAIGKPDSAVKVASGSKAMKESEEVFLRGIGLA